MLELRIFDDMCSSYFTIVSHVFTIPRVQSFLWNGGWTTVSSTLIMPWTCFSHLARKCSSASLYTWSLKTRTAKSPHFKTGWQIKSECSTGIRHISQTDFLALGDSSEKPSASEDVHCLQLMLRLSPKKDIAKKNQACGCVLGYALIHGHWNRDTGF